MLREDSESESVSRTALACLSAGLGLVVVSVIFIGRHRFFAALFPDAIVRGNLSQSASHLADVDCDGAATRADIVHADFAGFGCVRGHFATGELIWFELIGKCGKTGEVTMLVRGAVGHGLAANIAFYRFAHFSHQRKRVL